MSPSDAGELIRRARKCFRRGLLTHRQIWLLDTLLWCCRRPGAGEAVASYTTLQRLARVSRETIAGGVRRLAQLGLLQIIKRRVRVAWGGRVASRQATSAYRFARPATEFGATTVTQEIKIISPERQAAQEALAAVRARRLPKISILGSSH